MQNILQLILNNPAFIAPAIVVVFLIYFVIVYCRQYYFPARRLQEQVMELTSSIDSIDARKIEDLRSSLGKVFSQTSFDHCWKEFQETLHDQTAVVDGEIRVVRIRATSPAAFFFSTQKLVDTPLRTEYFKHLPGILTGLGIIGTFGGLMLGLYHFDVTDPSKVQESVSRLLKDVLFAFGGSMAAIIVAMVVTNSEKKHLRLCLSAVEELADQLDRLFDAGVSEEYLAQLVKHTQESSVQTRMLKDSLVTELKEMLQNLVESQVRENMRLGDTLSNAYKTSGNDIASQISASIEASFKEPLDRLAQSVQSATGDQSGKVQSLLQDVLVSFMQKIETTFGSQFQGMQEMLNQSINSMQVMQSNFATLVQEMRSTSESSGQLVQEQLTKALSDMHSSQSVMQDSMNEMIQNLQIAVSSISSKGQEAGAKMGEQLEKIFVESEARQQAMAQQMQAFVEGIKETVGKTQNDTMQKISESVVQLNDHLNGVMSNLDKSRIEMESASEASQQKMHAQSSELLIELSANVKNLIAALNSSNDATNQTIKLLGDQTRDSLMGMQIGAEKIKLASDGFNTASSTLVQVTNSAGTLIGNIQGTSAEINATTRNLSIIVSDYKANTNLMKESISAIEVLLNEAKVEATVRTQVLKDLQQFKLEMAALNQDAAEYLDKVNGVLGNAFESFDKGIEKSLSKSLASFDQELDKAVKALGGGVQELSENLDIFSEIVEKSTKVNR
jgi:molybdopterin biosynthesis enzyme MoaB